MDHFVFMTSLAYIVRSHRILKATTTIITKTITNLKPKAALPHLKGRHFLQQYSHCCDAHIPVNNLNETNLVTRRKEKDMKVEGIIGRGRGIRERKGVNITDMPCVYVCKFNNETHYFT